MGLFRATLKLYKEKNKIFKLRKNLLRRQNRKYWL